MLEIVVTLFGVIFLFVICKVLRWLFIDRPDRISRDKEWNNAD